MKNCKEIMEKFNKMVKALELIDEAGRLIKGVDPFLLTRYEEHYNKLYFAIDEKAKSLLFEAYKMKCIELKEEN